MNFLKSRNNLTKYNGIKKKALPKISIGMPVYNGERFLRKSIESLLTQTFTDFELIISDNASTDSTSSICDEYSKKDKRIRYFRQKKNMGLNWNYRFVLKEAKFDYFMWAAVDDVRASTYLEKNLLSLLSNNNAVCSMSKINYYGLKSLKNKNEKIDSKFRNFRKKLRHTIKPREIHPISGSYNKKVRFFLNKSETWIIFGLFRIEELRKSLIDKTFVGVDLAIILNVLKYGDIHVVNEVLLEVFDAGISNRGIIKHAKTLNGNFTGILFPFYPLTSWCAHNLGTKLFLKNFDYFFITNLWGCFSQLFDLMRILTKNFNGKSESKN